MDQDAMHLNDDEIYVPQCAVFRRFLKSQGLKFTSERAQILNEVLAMPGVFAAEQLLEKVRHADHRASKATVYRTLKHLVEAKIVSEVLIDSKQCHYRLSIGKEPKGHVVCMESGRIVEVDIPELGEISRRVCEALGYEEVSHRFVVYGLSPEAQKDDEGETE